MSSLSSDTERFLDFLRDLDWLRLRLLLTERAERTVLIDFSDFCDLTDFGDLARCMSYAVLARFKFSSKPRLLVRLLLLRIYWWDVRGVPKIVRSLQITGRTLSDIMSCLW